MILLPNRSVLKAAGADAGKFLQGLITNDIELLATQPAIYAGMLTPQGKLMFDFIISKSGDAFLLDTFKPRADALFKRLSMYKLRSDVDIEITNLQVYASSAEGVPDPRNAGLGKRFYGNRAEQGDFAEYEKKRIELGVPNSEDFVFDDDFPLQSNFESLNGVSFEKGCYVGQEVTARTKYKGNIKHAFYKIKSDSALNAGDSVMQDGKKIGRVASSLGNLALAHLEVGTNNATVNGAAISILH